MGLGKNRTTDIFKTLIKEHPEFQIIVIAGKNEALKTSFEEILNEYSTNNTVRVLGFTDKVPELMSISDLVVTKPGGLTTTESLASNLPMIIINPIPGQEEENAEFLESKKVAKWIKKDDDINFILNILVNDDTVLNNMKENTYLISKPNATENICKIIMN